MGSAPINDEVSGATGSPRSNRQFETTHWTEVLKAAQGDCTESREALAEICRTYWYPLYTFVRRRGYSAADAQDLTQAYFTRLIEKRYLRDVSPSAGRFRAFLLASLKHFLSNERHRARALKRGGGVRLYSLDDPVQEQRYHLEPKDLRSPEDSFERSWALTVVDRTMRLLEQEFRCRDRLDHFEHIQLHLTGERPKTSYQEIALALGVSEAAIKSEVLRARRRFGQLLRQVIGETVADPHEIDQEIHHLLDVLSR